MLRFMRKAAIVGVAAGTAAGLGLTGVSAASSPHIGNGIRGAAPDSGSHCQIQDDSGTKVTTLPVDTQTGTDAVYWLHFESTTGDTATVIFRGPAGGDWSQVQKVTGAIGDYYLPFGIPYWGSNLTTGTWHVKVVGAAATNITCSFTTTS